jgi:hypothetical protein
MKKFPLLHSFYLILLLITLLLCGCSQNLTQAKKNDSSEASSLPAGVDESDAPTLLGALSLNKLKDMGTQKVEEMFGPLSNGIVDQYLYMDKSQGKIPFVQRIVFSIEGEAESYLVDMNVENGDIIKSGFQSEFPEEPNRITGVEEPYIYDDGELESQSQVIFSGGK